MSFSFNILHASQETKGRLGALMTPHGVLETPAFIFCATKASLKSLTAKQIKQAETQIILSNTYHLFLQPGSEVIRELGGLHRVMNWDGPMLTDSGGFQIFSLGHGSIASEIKGKRESCRPKTLMKITEEGATFRSYVDGGLKMLTPEKSIEVQCDLGADLIVVLDECTPFHVEKGYTEKSMELSHRWALRSLKAFEKRSSGKQALYGIIQGGVYPDLRVRSCNFVNSTDFFGQAIGGSLGATKDQMYEVVGMTAQNLHPHRPTHLLGIGGIRDIFVGAAHGIDTFDCVHPTRLARHGGALMKPRLMGKEHINLRNAQYKLDDTPIDEACGCETCESYSKGYIHHLLKAGELLAHSLLTMHNVFFMNRLMKAIRSAIREERLLAEQKEWLG